MRVLFIAGFAPIVSDPGAGRAFYAKTLGIEFEGGQGDYYFTEKLAGAKHFGVWPLAEAAQACFGQSVWPTDVPAPQATIEFEVDDVPAAAAELQQRGYRLIHPVRTEPWKQIIARLLTPDGLLVGVCHTPWMH